VRILLLGASGFIGREIFAALTARGHRVVAAVRRASSAPPFASEAARIVDLNRALSPRDWLAHLEGIDAVVNCAGVLQATRSQSIEAIHAAAPIALFQACEQRGVRRVIQVSAISADREAGTAYALTKLAADEHLRKTALEWTVLRPSLVVARGAYGGTALLRAVAALPFSIPVPGDGTQSFQPIHVDDLSQVVALALETDRLVRVTLDVVGPQAVTLRDILEDYRRWLGFAPASIVRIPRWASRLAAWTGDRFGGTLNSTALAQLEHGNTGDAAAFARATGIAARGWRQSLALEPAHAQDRWHARLYFARPLLRYSLAFVWLASAIAGAFSLRSWGGLAAAQLPIGVPAAMLVLAVACLVDVIIALLLLGRWRPRLLALVQAVMITGYSVAATMLWPSLWAEALGPLAKNIPILAAALALGAIEEDR
jgi:uncharacterized protein YbjT (DUF2867 family)